MLRSIPFARHKYGPELLIDCVSFGEVVRANAHLPHLTAFYEIYIFEAGAGELVLDNQRLACRPGTVLLLPPATPRHWLLGPEAPTARALMFEGSFLESFLKDSLFLHRLHYFGNPAQGVMLQFDPPALALHQQLLAAIAHEIQHLAPDSHHLLRAYLYQLLLLLNRASAAAYARPDNLYAATDLLRFKELLAAHIQTKQTVNEYAALLHMPRNRLNKRCHEVFGQAASEVIKTALATACKQGLLYTTQTVAEISYDYHFSAPSNFVRFFKARTGLSPAEYRARYAK